MVTVWMVTLMKRTGRDLVRILDKSERTKMLTSIHIRKFDIPTRLVNGGVWVHSQECSASKRRKEYQLLGEAIKSVSVLR